MGTCAAVRRARTSAHAQHIQHTATQAHTCTHIPTNTHNTHTHTHTIHIHTHTQQVATHMYKHNRLRHTSHAPQLMTLRRGARHAATVSEAGAW